MQVLFKEDGRPAYVVEGVCAIPDGMTLAEVPETLRKYSLNYLRFSGGSVVVDVSDDPTVRIVSGEIVPTSDAAKAAKWGAIKAYRDRCTEQGGYKVGDKWFHSDQKSRSQQLGLVLLGANIPPNLQWKTMDGTFVNITQSLAQQILAAAAVSDQAIFAAAEAHRAAMEVSADPAVYDFTAGWPAVYEVAP